MPKSSLDLNDDTSVLERQIDHMVYERLVKGRIFQIAKLYPKGKVQGASFPHFREDRAITKDEDCFQNINKKAKVHDVGKHIDQTVYELYDLTPEEIAIVEGKRCIQSTSVSKSI